MTARERAARAALCGLAASVFACTDPETCVGRGAATSLTGVASYALGAGAGDTMAQTITVYDYTTACSYPGEEFPIAIGSCTLWALLQQGPEPPNRYFPGNSDAYADLEAGQTCDLPVVDGTLTVTVASGTVSFADGMSGIELSGTASSADAGDALGSSFEWQLFTSGSP